MVLVAALTLGACSAPGPAANTQSPMTANASSSAPQTAAPVPTDPKVALSKSLAIPAGLSPVDLAKKIAEDISMWQMAGATPALYKSWDPSLSVEDYTNKTANDQADTYATALFGPGYASKPKILEFVHKQISMNAGNLNAYIRTFDAKANTTNKVPYSIHSEVLSVVESTTNGDSTTLSLNWRETNNGNMNMIGPSHGLPSVVDSVAHITTKTNGSTEQLEAISFS